MLLSHEIAREIEDQLEYPGQVKVIVIRESRATEVAKVRLDHSVIAVSDWERLNSFYRDVLGAELVELDYGRWAYRFGEQQLNVHGPGRRPHRAR